jgi:hypothetical protein
MNNQEILDKYKDSLSILCGDTSNLNNEEFYDFEDKYKKMVYSSNIVEKSFSSITRLFNRVDALMYSRTCLFYRNNQWYKYNGNHPEQIQFNNAIQLTNIELFKLIKRTLYNREKNNIINKFLVPLPEYALNLDELNINRIHLIEFKNLTIDSQTYQEIKVILEYLLTIEEKYIIH